MKKKSKLFDPNNMARADIGQRRAQKEPALASIINIGDDEGIYIFNDGAHLFWTHGRGGFVVEGGLGFWPNTGDARQSMERYNDIANTAMENGLPQGVTFAGDVDDWSQLPDDIKAKAKEAFQSDRDGAYSLARRMENTPESENNFSGEPPMIDPNDPNLPTKDDLD